MPATSQAQRGLFGAAYSAKKAGKPKPDYVPDSIWKLSLDKMKEFVGPVKKKHGKGYMERHAKRGKR
jgi:hypothetical protein